jgi:hypothetical protein
MTDYLGNELSVGDKVVYSQLGYRNFKTGKIVKITNCFCMIENLQYQSGFRDRKTIKQEPQQLIKINN